MMFDPPHPGETLKELYLDPLDLTISAAARALNMTRSALSEIVNSRRGISPSVAIKLAKAFGGTAESWLHQQADFDLWQQTQTYNADDVEVIHAA
ncbi:MAG: HigA family addiction module antidote protein [Algicola sp.]|nr:HigA family addiction module antidote protein [Algicola sp.]